MANADPHILSREFDEERLQQELLNSRFRNYAKEKFLNSVQFDTDYIDFLRSITAQEAFKLPSELNDYHIRLDNAPLFWLSDARILEKAEELFANKNKRLAVVSDYNEIKKFYSKWITQKSEKEKQFFALSTINLIERNSNDLNFLKHILAAVVFSFDNRIYAPDKSLDLLNKSEDKIDKSKLADEIKLEFFYLINLYKGFVNFRSERIENASENFRFAETFKGNGVSAKLYNALIDNRLGNTDKAISQISSLIEYDKIRLNFAISHNYMQLYKFFLDNAAIYNVFNELELSSLFYEIEHLFNSSFFCEDKKILELNIMIDKITELKMNDYLDESIIKKLNFLTEFIKEYSENRNILVADSSLRLIEKLETIIEDIKNSITKKFYDEVTNEVRIFDATIEENLKTIEYLKREKDETRGRIGGRYNQAIKNLEEDYNETLKVLEYRAEGIESDKNLDPSNAFNNAMVVNLIISMLIFIFGGFAGTIIDQGGKVEGCASFFGQTMFSGIKWGGIAFVLGSMIAVFSSLSAIIERSNIKQRVLKQIAFLKNQKEREVNLLRRESEEKIKSLMDSYDERVEDYKESIESLKEDKVLKYKEYKQEADLKIEELHKKLTEILG